MTIDCPLTCYVCGVTSEKFITVDMIGCLKHQEAAEKRFIEKFGVKPEPFLFVCNDWTKKNKRYAVNVERKYGGVYE